MAACFLGSGFLVLFFSLAIISSAHLLGPPDLGGSFHWIRWAPGPQLDSDLNGYFLLCLSGSFSFPVPAWRMGGTASFGGEVFMTYTDLTKALLPLLFTTVPQDLMDVSMNILPSLWQPSPRKSSCSSCSQSGSTGGSSTNGCNHER